jgi:hypothetical protein
MDFADGKLFSQIVTFDIGGDLAGKVKEQRGRNFSEAQILDWFC